MKNNPINEMEQLAATIQNGTKNTLRDILSEAVSQYINEEILNEDDDEEQDAEVEETPENETSDDVEDAEISDDTEEVEETPEDAVEVEPVEDKETEGDEWADFDDYKIGNEDGSEEYDFTNETNPETLVKVFKLMKNDDQVSVVKDGDKLSIKDNEADTEYVIELDTECNNDECKNEMTMAESLGYTDNYQDKDPIAGLSMEKTPKNAKDWHKGVPTGTEKPWAGKGKSKPFGETSERIFEITLNDEIEDSEDTIEENHTRGAVQDRSTTISNAREAQPARNKRQGGKQVTMTTEHPMSESLQKKINAALLENKQLKETVAKVSKIMKEAVQVNVNLGHIVRLMVENSTTKAEKEDIVKRYNLVKSNEEAKKLYESISAELKKSHSTIVTEQSTTTQSSKQINESKIYDEPNGVLDLMKRMNMIK